MEKWYLWQDGTHSPYFNMAMDELLLEHAPEIGRPLIRIYRWDRKAVSFGTSQLFPEDAAADGYAVVRRPTGGGVVYHDCDLTYTAVIPAGHSILQLDRMSSYKVFHQALVPALEAAGVHAALKPDETPDVDRATMQCFVSPSRFDVMTEDGGKFAGAAQRRTRAGILHQGSLMLSATGGDWDKLAQILLAALASDFGVEFENWEPDAAWLDAADALAVAKYATGEWNHAARH